MKEAEPGSDPGIYQLTIGTGKWKLAAKFDGLTVDLDGWEGFPSITADGQLAMMSDTSVVQIYSAKWAAEAGSR